MLTCVLVLQAALRVSLSVHGILYHDWELASEISLFNFFFEDVSIIDMFVALLFRYRNILTLK